jgi:hypothetical protein
MTTSLTSKKTKSNLRRRHLIFRSTEIAHVTGARSTKFLLHACNVCFCILPSVKVDSPGQPERVLTQGIQYPAIRDPESEATYIAGTIVTIHTIFQKVQGSYRVRAAQRVHCAPPICFCIWRAIAQCHC